MLALLSACVIYTFLYIAVWKFNFLSGHVDRYGPLIALKTENVGFFDRFKKYKTFFEAYGYVGVSITVIIGTLVLAMLVFFLAKTLEFKPSPTGVYAPQNIFLIPGLNQFIPATIAVIVGILVAVMVHEFGHAILCRVCDIKLKSTGILLAVIPIGAFVDPNAEEMEQASIKSRVLVYGAGIMNNLVVGIIAFIVMLVLLSTLIGFPASDKVIAYGIDAGGPGYIAGVELGDWIKSIDGVEIKSDRAYFEYLQSTSPGDVITIVVSGKDGVERTISATLTERPKVVYARSDVQVNPDAGYLGVSGVNMGETLNYVAKDSFNPTGILKFMALPVMSDSSSNIVKIVVVDNEYGELYGIPFLGFWEIIRILFWIGWMNINIGLFNALPMIPLDGGYIFKDILRKMFGSTRYIGVASKITTCVSVAIVSMIIMIYLLPHIFATL